MNRWRRWLLRHAGHALLPLAAVWLVGIAGAIGGLWRPKPVLIALLVATFCGAAILALWSRWQREVAVREVSGHDARVVRPVPVAPGGLGGELQPEAHGVRRRLAGQATEERDRLAAVPQQPLVDGSPPRAAGR